MLYWPFVCATPTTHGPVYVNCLCCSWRRSAACNSPVMLCTIAWQKRSMRRLSRQKAKEGEEADTWENRLPLLSEWSHHPRWMKTNPGLCGERCTPLQKTSWRRGEARRVCGRRPFERGREVGREGYPCLRPTGAPTAPGDDSGYSHPGTHERPAAAGHRRQQQRECIGEPNNDTVASERERERDGP